jgi:hypothetical protein
MSDTESAPMKPGELGRYVCVLSCQHTGPRDTRTIRSDGVWVKQGPGGPFSSAHRDCFEAWRNHGPASTA